MFKKHVAPALTALAFVFAGSVDAGAQSYDYLATRGNISQLTAQQITDSLNAKSAQGWDAYAAVPEIHTGDTITVYRRPHITCGQPGALC